MTARSGGAVDCQSVEIGSLPYFKNQRRGAEQQTYVTATVLSARVGQGCVCVLWADEMSVLINCPRVFTQSPGTDGDV